MVRFYPEPVEQWRLSPLSWSRVSVKPKGLTRTNLLDFECLLYDRAMQYKLGPEKLTWFGKFKYTTAVRHHNIVKVFFSR